MVHMGHMRSTSMWTRIRFAHQGDNPFGPHGLVFVSSSRTRACVESVGIRIYGPCGPCGLRPLAQGFLWSTYPIGVWTAMDRAKGRGSFLDKTPTAGNSNRGVRLWLI